MIADSCFLIDLMSGDSKAIKLFETQKDFLVPAVVLTEVSRGIDDTDAFISFLRGFVTIDIDTPVALDAAKLMQKNDKLGKPVDICDALVASCARKYAVPIATRNKKHFEKLDVIIQLY